MQNSACKFACATAVLAAFTLPAAAQSDPAQGYPSRPIRLVVPFAPGGSTDIIARILAQKLGEAWNQQVVVENRPGAGGTIGVDYVAKSPADGYTLIFGHVGTFGFGPSLYPKLPYHPIRDFAPVIQFAMVPNMLVTHPSLPVKSVKDIVSLAKARPGQVNYASSGAGSASHLAVEYFKLLAKIDLTAIAYRGTGPMTVSLISGETSLTITGEQPLMRRHHLARPLGELTAFGTVEQRGFAARTSHQNAVEPHGQVCAQVALERLAGDVARGGIERGDGGGHQAAEWDTSHDGI
jgi:tripartite-type tricarboxylate transporter receptor subunit TctC